MVSTYFGCFFVLFVVIFLWLHSEYFDGVWKELINIISFLPFRRIFIFKIIYIDTRNLILWSPQYIEISYEKEGSNEEKPFLFVLLVACMFEFIIIIIIPRSMWCTFPHLSKAEMACASALLSFSMRQLLFPTPTTSNKKQIQKELILIKAPPWQ